MKWYLLYIAIYQYLFKYTARTLNAKLIYCFSFYQTGNDKMIFVYKLIKQIGGPRNEFRKKYNRKSLL